MRQLIFLTLLLLAPFLLPAQAPGSGHALDFFASGQYLSAPQLNNYHFDTDLTLEAWINPATISDQTIFGLNDLDLFGVPRGYTLRINAQGGLSLLLPSTTISTPPGIIQSGTWQHIAVISSPTTLKILHNGILVHSASAPSPITPASLPLTIARSPLNTHEFIGQLDELRIWNQALSETALRNWICQRLNPTHPNYPQLVGHWPLDDNLPATTADLSPSTNDLTISGSPTSLWSGAPIGDLSIHQQGGPYSLSLPGGSGDTLHLSNATGSPFAIYLYRVDDTPNFPPQVLGFMSYDLDHYFGIWAAGGNTPTIDIRYSPGTHPFFQSTDPCILGLAARDDATFPQWSPAPGTIDAPNHTFTGNAYPATFQFITGLRPNPYIIIANPNDTLCTGDTLELISLFDPPSPRWYEGTNQINGAISSSLFVTTTGNYFVEVTQGACNYASNIISPTFLPPTPVNFPTPAPLCADAPALALTATPVGGTYSGPGTNGPSFHPLTAGPGTHTITYSYTAPNSCTSTTQTTITVHPAPTAIWPPLPDICQQAGALPLTGALPAGGTYAGPGVIAATLDPITAGLGTVLLSYTYTDSNACDDTVFTPITILPNPPTPVISIAGNTLYSSTPFDNQWYNASGPIPGATDSTYAVTSTGTFYLIVTAPNGCPSDTSQPVTLTVDIAAPNFTPALHIYPHPVQTQTTISWIATTHTSCTITLTALTGQQVLTQTTAITPGLVTIPIDLSTLLSGTYILHLHTDTHRSARPLHKW